VQVGHLHSTQLFVKRIAISLQLPPDPFLGCIFGLEAVAHLYCAVQAAIGTSDILHLENLYEWILQCYQGHHY